MRPVERGACPQESGADKVFKRYQDAGPELCARIGWLCSYCGERLARVGLAVEHVACKDVYPELALRWDNFLLACATCNSIKGAQATAGITLFWPDRDNTARAFQYQEGGVIEPHPHLTPAQTQIARATLVLTGLNRLPGIPPFPTTTGSDQRWLQRKEAWDQACLMRDALHEHDTERQREAILGAARAIGFLSVWLAVFAHDIPLRQALLAAFPGTALGCFDAQTNPVPRPGGQL